MAKKLTPEKTAKLLKNPPSGRQLTDSQLQYFNDIVATEPPTLAPLAKSGAWLDKYNDGGPVQENYNDASASMPPGYVGLGYNTKGRNYSPAWGGQFAMGGALPGSVGFTYARTAGSAPANGKYTKKTKASAQLGIELMPYLLSSAASIAASIPTMEEVKKKAADVIKNSPKLRSAINKGISYVANTDWGKEKIKNFANNIDPHGYGSGFTRTFRGESPFNRIYSAAILNKKEDSRKEMDSLLAAGAADPGDSLRIDLINQYAGLPQKYNTVKPSAYKPTMGNKNDKYYSSPIVERQILSDIDLVAGNVKMKPEFKTKQDLQNFIQNYFGGEKGKGNNYVTPIEGLGTATTGVGEDEKGHYLSYYDNWDLNPYHGNFAGSDNSFEATNDKLGRAILGNEKENIATKKIGTPTQMYGRIYFDKKTGKPKMQNGGEMSFYQNGLDFKPKSISKNDSVIKDDRGQWAHPGKITEIGSNDITMQGVDYPVLGVSDTGDTQMMYPDQDYKFDGEKVTEFPMAQDGKWLNKYQEGATLMKDQKVGEKITEVAKYDLRPIKRNFKTTVKELYDPNCPDGIGCSKQATDVAQSITGLPRVAYAPADAGYRDAVAERTGLINIFDQEGEQKKNANSRGEGWKYPTTQDFTNWRAGDIVTLDAKLDSYFPYKAPKGFKNSDNTNTTHNGVITGFTETGRPIITHGGASGKNKGKQYTEVLGDDNRVTDLGRGRYAIKSIWRPKEVNPSGKVSSIENVIDTGEERAGRKQATTSNSSFYLKPTEEEKLQKDSPVGYEFSGASNRLDTKNKLVNLFNDEKLNKDLQYKLGITAQELDKLKPVVYGVFGQESNFNDVDNAGASFKELIGNLFGGNSRGAAQIKMSSLTADEKKVLGIKKASDLDKDEVAYKAALLMLNNSRKRMNQEVEQGTHPELADKDEYFRAGYYYNSPARAIKSSDEFSKKKNKKATFSEIKKNELRMDEGSYPYKLMERAKDLGVNMDFDATTELEPVVVRSMVKNNKGTTFVPKQETGGWLNKYK